MRYHAPLAATTHDVAQREEMRAAGFGTPLDAVDGAARVLDPIYAYLLNGTRMVGKLFKDYQAVEW